MKPKPFDANEEEHYFQIVVTLGVELIDFNECFGEQIVPRAQLHYTKWDLIKEHVKAELNQRLRESKKKTGAFGNGINLVRRELGKELLLLVWAIEDADISLIPAAIANWKGLVPEERWWLYNQTAAAAGGVNDRWGWRKAIRYALTENPCTLDGK